MPSLPCKRIRVSACVRVDSSGFVVRAGLFLGGEVVAASGEAHLLCLQRVFRGLDGHVLLAVDLDAVGDDGLGLALVVERGGDGTHLGGGQLVRSALLISVYARPCASSCNGETQCLLRTYGEAGGRGPGGLAGDIADDGLVNVASANEAAVRD